MTRDKRHGWLGRRRNLGGSAMSSTKVKQEGVEMVAGGERDWAGQGKKMEKEKRCLMSGTKGVWLQRYQLFDDSSNPHLTSRLILDET
ncbi:hypothetical protein ACFX2H_025566 [Malus domestica]